VELRIVLRTAVLRRARYRGRSLASTEAVRQALMFGRHAALILILVLSDGGAPWRPVGEVEQWILAGSK